MGQVAFGLRRIYLHGLSADVTVVEPSPGKEGEA